MSRKVGLLAIALLLVAPASALAAAPHLPVVSASILGTLGGVFSGIGHAVLGAFSWTIGLASKFILTTIAALVKLLIPHAWVNKGLQIMEWIVAVPNYAGQITTPGGGHEYGFAGINALRDLFMWLGIAAAPLTLVYATSRAMIGESEPIGIPVARMVAVAVAVASYPYWWAQAAALADQITHTILTLPEVSRGLYTLMRYAVAGVALGGWQLVDLMMMGAIGLELLALIFLKVAVILLGAVLYATGPLMIGLVPTRAGGALARAWASAVVMLLSLGIAWAILFAAGALLIGDSATAGPLIAGNSTFGSLMGGMLLAAAGLASLWLCLKAAKEAASLLRLQLAGLLTLHGSRNPSAGTTTAASRARTTGPSLREYGSRLARSTTAAAGELAAAVPGGAVLAAGGRGAGYVARRGLVGTAAGGARAGTTRAAGPAGALLGRSRAGAVAVGMARAGSAAWACQPTRTAKTPGPTPRPDRPSTPQRGNAQVAADKRPGGPQPKPTPVREPQRATSAPQRLLGKTPAPPTTRSSSTSSSRAPSSPAKSATRSGSAAAPQPSATPTPRPAGRANLTRSATPSARPANRDRRPSGPMEPKAQPSPPAKPNRRPPRSSGGGKR